MRDKKTRRQDPTTELPSNKYLDDLFCPYCNSQLKIAAPSGWIFCPQGGVCDYELAPEEKTPPHAIPLTGKDLDDKNTINLAAEVIHTLETLMQLNELYAKMTTEEVVEAIAKDAVEMLDRMVVRHKKALDENPYYPHTHTHPHS